MFHRMRHVPLAVMGQRARCIERGAVSDLRSISLPGDLRLPLPEGAAGRQLGPRPMALTQTIHISRGHGHLSDSVFPLPRHCVDPPRGSFRSLIKLYPRELESWPLRAQSSISSPPKRKYPTDYNTMSRTMRSALSSALPSSLFFPLN